MIIIIVISLLLANSSYPSIKGDVPFKSCKSSDEIFCQDLTNETRTSVTYDIKRQMHYFTWREIDEIIDKPTGNKSEPNDGIELGREIDEIRNKTTGNKSDRLIHGHHVIETLFVFHIFLYTFVIR